jgi:hypothetical protein
MGSAISPIIPFTTRLFYSGLHADARPLCGYFGSGPV